MQINVSDDDLTSYQRSIIHQLAHYFQNENTEVEILSREIDDLYGQVEELKEMENYNGNG